MLSYVNATITALQSLAQDMEYNAPLINVMERNCHENMKILGQSARIKDMLSGTYMFSAGGWDELEQLLDETEEELDTFMVNNSAFMKEICEKFPEAAVSEYHSYVMCKKDYRPSPSVPEDIEIKKLDLSWTEFILEQYRDGEFGNKRYISDRIVNGPGLGLTTSRGKKIAFVLQHKDGEAGPLVVEKKYRGMGLGSELLKSFNERLFKRNTVIFGFVKPGNLASAHMMTSSGYKKAEDSVMWVYRMKRGSLYLP